MQESAGVYVALPLFDCVVDCCSCRSSVDGIRVVGQDRSLNAFGLLDGELLRAPPQSTNH